MVRAWLFGRNARAVPRRKARHHRAVRPRARHGNDGGATYPSAGA